jgi:16S rRNA G966 N2-methylase RsmD
MARFERVNMNSIDWGKALSAFPDRIVFQTPAWLSFLAETLKAEPVLAALKDGNDTLGYFTGLIVRQFGLKILGSPFQGWSSPYMGFILSPSTPRRIAAEALSDFAFKELRCIHFEVVDSLITLKDIEGLGFTYEMRPTIEIDLTQSEEALFSNMSSSCRRNIRQAEKYGVVIEEAKDADFAEDYSAQLKDVYAKQGLVPHYGVNRVRALIKHLFPTGMLLMLRARDSEGRCIATGVFPAMNQTVFYWGGASWRQYQKLYPNHLLHWFAMRYWKKHGMSTYNMVGTMEFKRRFGGRKTAVLMVHKSKYRLISRLRSSAPQVVETAQHLTWKLKTGVRGKRSATSIFGRMRSSLRHQGLSANIVKLCVLIEDHLFDIRYGVDTCTWSHLDKLTIDYGSKERGISYQPSRVMALRKLFNIIRPMTPSDSVLVDFGCGKGRVLFVASEFGIREVRGVEFAHELCEIAVKNSAVYKSKTGVETQYRIIESDAANYTINREENLFFLYNPFDEVILRKVLCNIAASLEIQPRKIWIIYHNPKYAHVIEQQEDLEPLREFSFWGYDFTVYSNLLDPEKV